MKCRAYLATWTALLTSLFALGAASADAAPPSLYEQCDELQKESEKAGSVVVKDALDESDLESDLTGKIFVGVTFLDNTLGRRKDFRNTRWLNASLGGADLSDAKFDGAVFCQSDLSNANLDGASFKKAKIHASTFEGSHAIGADFSDAHMNDSLLRDADFSKATLDRLHYHCTLDVVLAMECGPSHVVFDHASLKGARLYGLYAGSPYFGEEPGPVSSFKEADMDGAFIEPAIVASLDTARYRTISIIGATEERFTRDEIAIVRAHNPWTPVVGNPNTQPPPPSFSCTSKASVIEKAICASGDLVTKDRILNALYNHMLKASPVEQASTLKGDQRAWLSETRKACNQDSKEEVSGCLSSAYRKRIDSLFKTGSRTGNLPKPVTGTFRPVVSEIWRAPPEASAELAEKMHRIYATPGEGDSLVLTSSENGKLEVEGSSLGANGHLCSVEGELAEGRKGSGEYFVNDGTAKYDLEPVDESEETEEEDRQPEALVLRFAPPYLLTSGGRFFCGARAGWYDEYQLEIK